MARNKGRAVIKTIFQRGATIVNTQLFKKNTTTTQTTSDNNAKLEYKSNACINIRFIFTRTKPGFTVSY